MPNFDELTWEEAMRRGHAALLDCERLYDDINVEDGHGRPVRRRGARRLQWAVPSTVQRGAMNNAAAAGLKAPRKNAYQCAD
jgi:hypothetical protein